MRTTLFYIPHEAFGWPVFGFGWLLLAWLVLCCVLLATLVRRQGWSQDTLGYLPFMAIIAGAIAFLLPGMEEVASSGVRLGLPIRGFGVMMMLATVASVGLACYRAWQMGIDPEVIYSLTFWMFIAGIAGARTFYIIEYWQEFQQPTLLATLQSLANVTRGGLVVYGSVLGGLPAGIYYLWRRGLPILAMADVIAPSMVVGLALGRVGCFLNGCCFGGVCLDQPQALTFPAGSPPYLQQLQDGWRSGVWLASEGKPARDGQARDGQARDNEARDGQASDGKPAAATVGYVLPGGGAAQAGLKAGDVVTSINGVAVHSLADARRQLSEPTHSYEFATADGRILRWTINAPPLRSVPVHPTQLYGAVGAALLAMLLWNFYPFRRRDGEVFALLVTLYPICRFVLETIRSDEPGQFGTGWTISQWVSVGVLACACALWAYIERRRPGSALPLAGPRNQDAIDRAPGQTARV